MPSFCTDNMDLSLLTFTQQTSALADSLASFFTNKISKVHLSLANSSTSASPHSPSSLKTPPDFPTFKPASECEISKNPIHLPQQAMRLIPSLPGLSKNVLHSWSLLSLNIVNLSVSCPHSQRICHITSPQETS